MAREDGDSDIEVVEVERPAKRPRQTQAPGLSQRNMNTQGDGPSFQVPLRRPTQQHGVGPSTTQRARMQSHTQAEPEQLPLRREGLAGQLKKIRLEDFMCHECFEMEFGPHITLVSGTNGSGKSAVMQALQVCLGVSARVTGRGQSLAGFIRTGASEARIMVTLWNKGPEAFEHDKFGDFIIVERRITDKAGAYFMKNANGRIVSSSKEMQEAMKEHFAIDAANPLTVVTQDMARCFLSGSKDDNRKKYDMYMRGTLLFQIQDFLTEAYENLYESQKCVGGVKKEKLELERKLKEASAKISQLQDLDAQVELLSQIEQIRAWSLVDDAEREIATYKDQLAAVPEKVEELEQQVESADARRRAAQEQIKAMTEELERAINRDQAAKEGLKEAKSRHAAAKRERHALEGEVARYREAFEETSNDCKHCEDNILKGADNAKVAEAKARLQEFEDNLKAMTAASDKHQEEYSMHRGVYHELTEQRDELLGHLRSLSPSVSSIKSYIQNLEKDKQDLQQSASNRTMAFGGQAVSQLVELIKRHRRSFEYQPIGPVGSYLTIADSKWSLAIDTAIGRLLCNFICFSKKDAELLRRLVSQANAHRVSVLQTRPGLGLHNITIRPKDDYTTVLDVLRVTEEAVAKPIINMLVDSAKVERTVLVNSDNEGRDVIYKAAAGPGFNAIAINGNFFMAGKTVLTVKPRDSNSRPPSLGLDMRQQVQQLDDLIAKEREKLAKDENALQVVKQQLLQLEARIKEMDGLSHAAMAAKRKVVQGMSQIIKQRQALAPEAADGSEESRLAAATETLQELRLDLAKAQLSMDEKQRELEAALQREQELYRAYTELREQVQSTTSSHESYAKQMEQAAQAEGEAQQEQMGAQSTLDALREETEQCKQQLAAEQEALPLLLDQAESVCAREEAVQAALKYKSHMLAKKLEETPSMPEDEHEEYQEAVLSDERLDAEYKRLTMSHRMQERALGGSKEQLEAEYRMLNKQLALKSGEYQLIKKNQDALIAGHTRRIHSLQELRKSVEDTCNERFHKYMARRGHLGQLTVDHKEELARIKVKVKGLIDTQAPWVTDLKQLSGGERSYTTVAFLLALGQWSESSFRCLDEFDVFMDAINRRIAVETLLESALELTDKQYVLLTPQDIQAVEDARQLLETKRKQSIPEFFVRTVQMRPARR